MEVCLIEALVRVMNVLSVLYKYIIRKVCNNQLTSPNTENFHFLCRLSKTRRKKLKSNNTVNSFQKLL